MLLKRANVGRMPLLSRQRRLRVAVIGAGWYAAQNHIPVLAARKDVELDAVNRLGATELARVKDHFGFAFASEDFREVLERSPDAVVVASPHPLHFEHASAALAAGAHVLCEKPMTLDPLEAWALVEQAHAARRTLLVANGYHYLPGVSELRTLIQDGAVGRIEHVMCSFISATRAVFEGEAGMARWQTAFFRPDRGTWQDPTQGGGFAYGQMSHSIALALWLTGLVPKSISARTFATGSVDLCGAATLLCEKGETVSLSGAAGMPEGERALLRLFVTGSGGLLEAEFDRDRCELRRHDGRGHATPVAPGQWAYHCEGPVHALVDLAQGAGENRSPGEIGAVATSVISAMLRSAREDGRPVPVMPMPRAEGSTVPGERPPAPRRDPA